MLHLITTGPTLYDEETESQDWVESLPRNCQTMAKFCNKVLFFIIGVWEFVKGQIGHVPTT